MAQTKRKRRRKHRGTQGGSIDRRRARGRPRSREEARARAQRTAEDRRMRPPTWSSAINRALIGGAVFLALMMLLFGRGFGEAFALAAVMTAIYVPLGYWFDRFFYNRRRAQEQRARLARRDK
jgi:hypothetical protein